MYEKKQKKKKKNNTNHQYLTTIKLRKIFFDCVP